ncbi:type II secretion system protein GspM [Stenotrophomonas sp. MMGLT7]|uniref:type II secretion system protein GspM n=1 Tax=Stenotrophomonas sp. MMGLT7 TaxID=2901227 RepID=UPI001E5CB182|nr:type II secretion system protein GspM [Stenotrophomonas sp. MMGLT7]MCD7098951.1 type II secretion system protein M [Stenotrophomonas sp. MMGLT7]
MKARIEQFRLWWQRREPRERLMLGAMCAAIAAFVLWYALFVPLRMARDSAQARHERATLALLQTELELAQLRQLQQRRPPQPADAAALKRAVLDSAGKAALAVSRERDSDPAGFGIEADAASPRQLFAWLDALRNDHGLAPSSLSAARSEGGLRVQAGFALAPSSR